MLARLRQVLPPPPLLVAIGSTFLSGGVVIATWVSEHNTKGSLDEFLELGFGMATVGFAALVGAAVASVEPRPRLSLPLVHVNPKGWLFPRTYVRGALVEIHVHNPGPDVLLEARMAGAPAGASDSETDTAPSGNYALSWQHNDGRKHYFLARGQTAVVRVGHYSVFEDGNAMHLTPLNHAGVEQHELKAEGYITIPIVFLAVGQSRVLARGRVHIDLDNEKAKAVVAPWQSD